MEMDRSVEKLSDLIDADFDHVLLRCFRDHIDLSDGKSASLPSTAPSVLFAVPAVLSVLIEIKIPPNHSAVRTWTRTPDATRSLG